MLIDNDDLQLRYCKERLQPDNLKKEAVSPIRGCQMPRVSPLGGIIDDKVSVEVKFKDQEVVGNELSALADAAAAEVRVVVEQEN